MRPNSHVEKLGIPITLNCLFNVPLLLCKYLFFKDTLLCPGKQVGSKKVFHSRLTLVDTPLGNSGCGQSYKFSSVVTENAGKYNQCDQLTRLFVQYLVIYNNKNLPNNVKNCQSRLKIGQTLNKLLQTCPRLLEYKENGQIWLR